MARQRLKKISMLLFILENELLAVWSADEVFDVVNREAPGLKVLSSVTRELKRKK